MVHARFQDHGSSASEEEIVEDFWPRWMHLDIWAWQSCDLNSYYDFVSLVFKGGRLKILL